MVENYSCSENIFSDTLYRHTPVKKKILEANHVRYNTKTLGKVIMKRSNLQTKCSKTRTPKPLKKNARNRKTIAIDCTKRNTKLSSVI